MGITPCTDSSLLCFALKDAVSSGREFCEWAGFEVSGANHDDTPLASFLTDEDAGSGKCFGADSNDEALRTTTSTRPADPEAKKKRKLAAAREARKQAAATRKLADLYKRVGIFGAVALLLATLVVFRQHLIRTVRRWQQMVKGNASPEDIRKQRAAFLKQLSETTSVSEEPSWAASS
jgi:hypothetical protein